MSNILVAFDLSPVDTTVLQRALHLADISGARLHILNVAPILTLQGEADSIDKVLADTREQISRLVEANAEYGRPEINIHVVSRGRICDRIREYCGKTAAVLLIMGRAKPSMGAAHTMPSTIDRVISEARLPILVVHGARNNPYRSFITDADRSTILRSVLPLAKTMSTQPEVNIFMPCNATSGNRATGIMATLQLWWSRKRMELFHQTAGRILSRDGERIGKIICLSADPPLSASRLLDEVRQRKVDILVLPYSGTGLPQHRIGGRFGEVLSKAPVDVLVV